MIIEINLIIYTVTVFDFELVKLYFYFITVTDLTLISLTI